MRRVLDKIIYSLLFLSLFLVTIGVVSSLECWDTTHSANQSACEQDSGCTWFSDPWGSWCSQKGCWNLYSQTDCNQGLTLVNKSCSWKSGTSSGWCMEIDCWVFDGTNNATCEGNPYGLRCNWVNTYSAASYSYPCVGPSEKGCWQQQNSTACTAIAGCSWGECNSQSCYDQTTQANCIGAFGYSGGACKWNSQYSYCYESGCWDHNNITGCQAAGCSWSGGSCYKPSCYDYGYSNESYCTNNSAGLKCNWNDPWCEDFSCWNHNTETVCNLSNSSTGKQCYWETYSGGWCSEVGCWDYEGTNESACVNDTYGLTCTWNDPWCYEDISSKSCSNLYSERECMDTFYCWWNQTAVTCNDPVSGSIETSFIEWSPGCYIFDTAGQTVCNNATACYWDSNDRKCLNNDTVIPNGQLNCTFLTNKTTCDSMAMLSTCCKWQGGSCDADRFSTVCRDEMQEPPEGCYYCEDYIAYTNKDKCEKISKDPWYMPCRWDNSTERCMFKYEDVFTAGKENLMLVDNKQSCETAGGKWIVETYCSSNNPATAVAIPMGRCEFKFDEERNCNKECHACDYKSDKTNWSSVTKAKDACTGSLLGICNFTQDATAPNSYGYCKPKEEFLKGVAKNCDADCGSCTYMGDSSAAEPEKRPSYYCKNSKSKCKWIPDINYPTDESKGRCGSNAEKTCEDRCDMCFDQQNCVNKGSKKGNTSMDTQCTWDANLYMCTSTSGGNQMEICWDGLDNNQDGKMDCADSMCWSDPFCGGAFMMGFSGMDCFGYADNNSCESAGCAWISENWGSWCDMPGARCWKHDGNEAACNANGNCSWHSGFGGWCEENWTKSDSCMNLGESACWGAYHAGSECIWVEDSYYSNTGGGWCDPDQAYVGSWYNCVQHDSDGNATCEAAGTADSNGVKPCSWYTSTGSGYAGGWCDHMKFACWQFNNETSCTDPTNNTYNHSTYCTWRQDEYGGWCEGKTMSGGGGSTSCWSYSGENDCNNAGCKWMGGFCDPVGFGGEMGGGAGGMGGSGVSCFKYDGNQTGCEATAGCGWFAEDSNTQFCGVNFASDCPQYSYNATICNQQARCKYNPINCWGNENDLKNETCGFCDEKPFECFWNTTLNNVNLCNAHNMCNWSSSGCQPRCFNITSNEGASVCNDINATGTNTSVCRWMTGWCNPGAAAQFFKGMETGAPVPLGTDTQGDATPMEVDILGFGMKDMGMGKSFGLGINVASVENASMCNGIKLSTGATGKGENTTTFYWYLDTDATATGGCAVRHDSSQVGFEFYLKGSWTWDNSSGKSSESLGAYKCTNGSWVKAAIPISSITQVACVDINGGMIAIEKSELEKFPDLYKPGVDLRVTVATANSTGNITSPSDVIASTDVGYATPGAFDQNLEVLDLYKYKANASDKVGKGMGTGYISYTDVDCWTVVGCADYQCKNHPFCVNGSYGVQAPGFTDTRVPKIIGMYKETYADSALIVYFTDKPANGTLTLYGPSPTCETPSTPYNPVHDIGITDGDVREFKLWHIAEINNESLGSPLANNVTQYYRITVCDNESKCGKSKCSALVTETTNSTSCPFCKFVARIDAPSNWNVSYDIDRDGSYEHIQGTICGEKAGILVDYSNGRRVNIMLTKNDNSTYIEFINATLTKIALSTNIRTVNTANAFKAGTNTTAAGETIGVVGMIEDTRDKIVNNLHPSKCYVKMPKGGGNCSELWHCNTELTKCINRTAEATCIANMANYCVWQIPYCEFSSWAGGQPGTSTTTPPPTSTTTPTSSGGTTAGSTVGGYIRNIDVANGATVYLGTADTGKFVLKGKEHIIDVKEITNTSVRLEIRSTPITLTFGIGDRKNVDVDDNGYDDLFIRLDSIVDGKAELYFKEIIEPEEAAEEEVTEEEEEVVPTGKATVPVSEEVAKFNWKMILIVVAVTLVVAGVTAYVIKKRK